MGAPEKFDEQMQAKFLEVLEELNGQIYDTCSDPRIAISHNTYYDHRDKDPKGFALKADKVIKNAKRKKKQSLANTSHNLLNKLAKKANDTLDNLPGVNKEDKMLDKDVIALTKRIEEHAGLQKGENDDDDSDTTEIGMTYSGDIDWKDIGLPFNPADLDKSMQKSETTITAKKVKPNKQVDTNED